ncbi:precorrin-6Y C5,15-methyltransferase (decarboxylating) [Ectothiorhodosinus mongolicus]|uniref:Precorrin-6Y C5,15-methyltransferase (Decarboxylating) n=2 Tax=Ectothiorhodosinus mongolicus TaxID=233100 RepID=A0A1R3VWS3_9GAMM|nr:bifunctional cobalt-precorrin-7 (C(5))-methyltransferase/cobalt-precorrin-6B (C(15))-methyltransferase [Ectothiorhodosinus mongolicus]SIT69403.1 precorrin-6Y C5,15-methyltransferase (decarboxylating) [Ectothiorhodosinus mongolicus]
MDHESTPPETSTPWLSIIGLGEEGVEGLSPAARQLLAQAHHVFGARRHLQLTESLIGDKGVAWKSPLSDSMADLMQLRGEAVAVLASGDPFLHGIGNTLRRFLPAEEMLCVPTLSSLTLAAARLKWEQKHRPVVSLTHRPLECLRPALQPGRGLFVLSADASSPRLVCEALSEWGFGDSRVWVLESLGGPRERIRQCLAKRFTFADVAALNLMGLEVKADPGARIWPVARGLPDDWFEHDGQITKREIRAVTLSSLQPQAGQLLWDVGCGSGSVSIEWLLAHKANQAIGIEVDVDRAARATRNSLALGVPQFEVRIGQAPDLLLDLPTPDAIFIGGGARNPELIETCWTALRAGGRLVVNCVAVETELVVQNAWQKLGGHLSRLSVERLDAVGQMHAFRPGMTVLQWVVQKPEMVL